MRDDKKEKKEVGRKVRGEKDQGMRKGRGEKEGEDFEERRTRRGEVKKRGDWAGKRGEMREQRRREEEQADWIFQRSVISCFCSKQNFV